MNDEIFAIEQRTDLSIVFLLIIFEFVLLISFFPSPCGFFGCCGEDYLFLRDKTLRAFYFSLVIIILQVIATLAYFRSGTQILGCALWFLLLGNIFIPIRLWQDIPETPSYYEDLKAFYTDERFIGRTRSEVITVFGEDYREYQDLYYQRVYNTEEDVLSYPIYHAYSDLIFIFKDDKVVHYTLECEDY